MKKEIVRALPGIMLFAILCGGVVFFSGLPISTGEAVMVGVEDVWMVQVSLIEGPIGWTHIVESEWAAESYVKQLEEDERYGGYWVIYRNGVEYDANRWHKYGE